MIYTINGKHSDKNGNFTILASDLGVAPSVHTHAIADVYNLEYELLRKSNVGHTHVAIVSIQAGSTPVTGNVELTASSATVSLTGDTISLNAPIETNVDLNNAPSVVNYRMGRPAYLFVGGTWDALAGVRKGNDYSVASVSDEAAMLAFTSKLSRPIVDMFLYQDGTVTKIAKVLNESNAQSYPPPAFDKIRISTTLDDAVATRQLEGEQYPVPVMNNDDTTFSMTVVPYPPNGSWYLECDQFEIPKTIYTGTQTVEVTVPTLPVGTHVCIVKVIPNNTTSPTTIWGANDSIGQLKFVRVVMPESSLVPAYHWPLDNTMQEIVTNKTGVFHGEAEGDTPEFVTDAVRGAAYKAPNTYAVMPDRTGVWTDGIEIDPSVNGFTLAFFVKRTSPGRNEGTYTRWYDGTNTTTIIGIETSYGRIGACWMSEVYSSNEIPFLSTSKYSHACMTVSKPLTEADGLTTSELNNAWYFNLKLYLNGKLYVNKRVSVYKAHASRLTNIGGPTHSFGIGAIHYSRDQNSHEFDEVKIFGKELALEEVQQEAAMAGYTFEGDEDTPTVTPTKQYDEPRVREGKPEDITSVPLTADLKVFVIDKNTIAVAGNYETFYNQRLQTEYPTTLVGMEQNYRNGLRAQWIHEFYYKHSMWELQADYEPRILDAYDADDYFKVNNQATTWLGSWSNASGCSEVPDVFDQTRRYRIEAANIVHFAYLRLPFGMVENTEYTVVDNDGNTVAFTYGKTHPVSSIKVNQEGYPANSPAKVAYLGAWLGSAGKYTITATEFEVVNEAGTVVFTGTPVLRDVTDSGQTLSATRIFSGETVYEMDFSSVTTPGVYRIHISGVGYSWPFTIGQKVNEKLFYYHARGLFHQRSGIEKKAPQTQWPMKNNQYITWEAPFPGEDKNLDGFKDSVGNWASLSAFNICNYQYRNIPHREVYGGWWDAADWDRRSYHLQCVQSLASAYLMYPTKFTDNQLDLPESGNGIPDILSEAMWGADVWRRAQRPEGGVGLWIECAHHPTQTDAAAEESKFCMAEPTAYGSLHYALTVAQLSRALKLAGAYKQADMYADSAIRAFHWGVNNLAHIEVHLGSQDYVFDEPAEKVSGRTWLRYRKQLMFWAAGQMYLLTGETQYAAYFTDEYWNEYKAVFDIDDAFFSNVFWELAEMDLSLYSEYMYNWILNKANIWKGYQEQYAYRAMTFPPGNNYAAAVAWGNCHPNRRGQLYSVAYYLTKDSQWLTPIQHGLNWLTGCNEMGRSITTGLGKVSPVRILSKIDEYYRAVNGTHDPVPGITYYAYGTNGLASDAVNQVYLLNKSARSDSNYLGCTVSLMPGRLRSSVSPAAGPIAVHLQNNLPMWRSTVAIQDFGVSMNEFTVSETIGGNVLLIAPLLEDAWTPEASWNTRTPVTDPKELEGYVFLP
jgi:endoglucanase